MRLESLRVTNFRAIRQFSIDSLGDVVVVAGPNGCGKSAVLHAIRLLKSLYGGYRDNEYQRWFNEFQIKLDPLSPDLSRLFRDPSERLELMAEVSISDRETEYLRSHGTTLIEAQVWNEVAPQAVNWSRRERPVVTARFQDARDRVAQLTEKRFAQLTESLDGGQRYELSLTIGESGHLEVERSPAMSLLFATYDPANLGIVEYHADTRQYDRASMGNLNVNFGNLATRRMQHALYDIQQKYQNLRSDLLTSYLTGLVRKDAGLEVSGFPDLLETLKELFRSFFPGKEFVGPVPREDGTVEFPVRLQDGSEHDIADLSAGEKEIVFGYLRLHGLNPRDSILLFDEPELHLNPRLMTGLADFYSRHLGAPRGNQLWMTTHSDTLLREAIGKPGYSVYHMRTMAPEGSGQAVAITGQDELNQALIDIVGDLAAFQPGRPVLVLEGGGEDLFDATMVQRLFPQFAADVNLVSGGSKRRVRELYGLLGRLRADGILPFEVWAIVDRDADDAAKSGEAEHILAWDRYHIENYLLEDHYVFQAVVAAGTSSLKDPGEVSAGLKAAARSSLDSMVEHELRSHVNSTVVRCIDLGGPPEQPPSTLLAAAIQRSFERLEKARAQLTLETLRAREIEIRGKLVDALEDESWRSSFRGRDILKGFVHEHVPGSNYQVFRNLILDKMASDRFEPPGMQTLLYRLSYPTRRKGSDQSTGS